MNIVMGNGKTIEVDIEDKQVRIRDYGRGIPLGSVIDCVSKINTGAKYDSKVFQKSCWTEWRWIQSSKCIIL